MATKIGELVWKITGDTKNIDKSLKSTDSKMAKFGKSVVAAFSVAALVLFAKKAYDVGKVLIGAASDAEETANKFGVVFNGLTDAAEAADNLAESYGLSHEASQNLLSGTADLLQGFGVAKDESLDLSVQVQQLAADLSSFTNNEGGAEAASKALTSAMLGEREAVKSLGIAITDAELKLFAEETGQVFNEMTKGEKAILTLNLAIKQSANAIGDFERSQDSFANQSKIASANIDDLRVIMGDKLLPVSTKIVTAFNNIVGALIDIQLEKINLDKAFAGDETADYTKALEEQRRVVATLEENLIDLTGVYGVNTKQLEAEIATEKEALESLTRTANGRMRDTQQRKLNTEATNEDNEAKREAIRLAGEEEQAIEDRGIAAAEAHQMEVAARVAAFEEQLRIEEEAALIESEILQIRNDARIADREAEQEQHDQRIANLQKELEFASQVAGNLGQIFGTLIQIQMSGDDEMTNRKKRNIITLYRIQQAANIAQIIMDTRAGVMRQFKDLPVWLAIASKIAIIGIGIASIAAVAATPPPVALAEGGIVPARPGGTSTILGEGGQDEAVIPLDEGGGFGQMTFNLYMDSDIVASTTVDKINAGQYTINLSRGTV